jgi:hypothetical protein
VKKSRSVDWNPAISAGENARRALPRLAREFFAQGRAATEPTASPAQLHAFRLASKRFRYSLELFLPLYGPRLAERVDQVRKIQSLLGDRQDCVVLGERLKKKDGLTASLHATLEKLSADGRAIEEKFRRHWQASFDAPGEEAAWIRYLSRRPPAPRGSDAPALPNGNACAADLRIASDATGRERAAGEIEAPIRAAPRSGPGASSNSQMSQSEVHPGRPGVVE